MTANAKINQITSPTRGANRQGATKLEIGHVQLGQVLFMEGVYNNVVVNNNVVPQLRRATNLVDGNTHVDTFTGAQFPWYHTQQGTPSTYKPPNNNGLTIPQNLITVDRPAIPGTDRLSIGGDPLDFLNIQVQFQLFIAVRTTNTDLDAHTVFTQRAVLNNGWAVNLSGSMPGTAAPNNFGTWAAIGVTGNTPVGNTPLTITNNRNRITAQQNNQALGLFGLQNADTLNKLLTNPNWTTGAKSSVPNYPAAFNGTNN